MILHAWRILPIPDVFEMLHVGFSMNCILSGSLRAECAVLAPSIKVAAIPEEARAKAIYPFERILARIKEIKQVFPVLSGEHLRNKIHRLVGHSLHNGIKCDLLFCEKF